jgi:hypothetical protein
MNPSLARMSRRPSERLQLPQRSALPLRVSTLHVVHALLHERPHLMAW